jgi:hypothetical protein
MTQGIDIPDCQACEALLCDYVDGTLSVDLRAAVEAHLTACPACAAFIEDARLGMAFLQDTEPADPPPALVNRILYQIPTRASGWTGLKGRLARLFEPVMQPRIVMGAMMTVLSLAMMTRCAGIPNRSVTPGDLDPVRIWSGVDNRMHRAWDRTMKTYDSMRVVYEIRSRLREWEQQQQDQDSAAKDAAAKEALRNRELPARSPGTGQGATGQGAKNPASGK